MLRSVGAVIAGFATMAVLVMVGTMAIMAAIVPGGLATMREMRTNPQAAEAMTPTVRYMAMNLAWSLVAAFVGGWVTSRVAARSPRGHLMALAALVLVMGVVSAFSPGANRQPAWYRLAVPMVGIAGVALSALVL